MRQIFVNTLYEILASLKDKAFNNGFSYLANPIPARFIQSGLYFFFDPHILRANGENKIVRIGKTGNNENNRLLWHQNGPADFSVFRRHIGRALTQLHGHPVEEIVISTYIHPLPYLVLPVTANHLDTLEKRCIEIISNRNQHLIIDAPVDDWLGNRIGPGINQAIHDSHLWNVHHTGNYQHNNNHIYTQALELLANYVNRLQ